jgi:hypothetical protein
VLRQSLMPFTWHDATMSQVSPMARGCVKRDECTL